MLLDLLYLKMIFLFGELTAAETICHLIVINGLEECIFSIPSPFDEGDSIELYVTLDEDTKNTVQLVNRFSLYYS